MITLGYWNLRGLGQSIRYMLEYVNEEYEETRYNVGPAPDFSIEEWQKVKFDLGMDLPNLPYYMEGDLKITQSNAILRHIARKHSVYCTSGVSQSTVEMVMDQVIEFLMGAMKPLFYTVPMEQYINSLPDKLGYFEKYLNNKLWLCGEKILMPDFLFYEALHWHIKLVPSLFDKFPNIQAFRQRFEDLPRIKSYMATDRHIKAPIFGPFITLWPNKPE